MQSETMGPKGRFMVSDTTIQRLNKLRHSLASNVETQVVKPLHIAGLVLWIGVRWVFSKIPVSAILSGYMLIVGMIQFYILFDPETHSSVIRYVTADETTALALVFLFFAGSWVVSNWRHPITYILTGSGIILYALALALGTLNGEFSTNALLSVADKLALTAIVLKAAFTSYETEGTFTEMFEVLAGAEANRYLASLINTTENEAVENERDHPGTIESSGRTKPD